MTDPVSIIAEQIEWWQSNGFSPGACLAALGYKIRLSPDESYVVEWGRKLPVNWVTVERAARAAYFGLMEERGAA